MLFLNSWRVSSRIVRYDISPPAIQKQHWHSREAQIELPLMECEWAFRIRAYVSKCLPIAFSWFKFWWELVRVLLVWYPVNSHQFLFPFDGMRVEKASSHTTLELVNSHPRLSGLYSWPQTFAMANSRNTFHTPKFPG
jgi:hypothetical protein